MLLTVLTKDCLLCVLDQCDSATIEVLYHVPELIPVALLEKYCTDDTNVLNYAIQGNYFELCKWALRIDYELSYNSYMLAASEGRLEMLGWLRSQHAKQSLCPFDSRTCSSAAGGGHLEVLKWLRLNGGPACGWGYRQVTNYRARPVRITLKEIILKH